MTKNEFLANPLQNLARLSASEIPSDWIREAWLDDLFRREAEYALSRSVSKTGSFRLASGWLNLVRGALSGEQVVRLYEQIRDNSCRLEMEWREEFERAFPQYRGDLPKIEEEAVAYYFTEQLFWSIAAGNVREVRKIVRKASIHRFPLIRCGMPLNYFRKIAVNLESMRQISDSECAFYWTPLELARRLGQSEIENVLLAAGAK